MILLHDPRLSSSHWFQPRRLHTKCKRMYAERTCMFYICLCTFMHLQGTMQESAQPWGLEGQAARNHCGRIENSCRQHQGRSSRLDFSVHSLHILSVRGWLKQELVRKSQLRTTAILLAQSQHHHTELTSAHTALVRCRPKTMESLAAARG